MTSDMTLAVVHGLIGRFFTKIREKDAEGALCALDRLKNLELDKKRDRRAMELRGAFLVITERIKNKEPIGYSDLAKALNEKYDLGIPEFGSSMGRKIGGILGELSAISYLSSGLVASIYVVNKNTGEPGGGLENLYKELSEYACESPAFDKESLKRDLDEVFDTLRRNS